MLSEDPGNSDNVAMRLYYGKAKLGAGGTQVENNAEGLGIIDAAQ